MAEETKSIAEVFPKLTENGVISDRLPFLLVSSLSYEDRQTKLVIRAISTRMIDYTYFRALEEEIKDRYFTDSPIEVTIRETYDLPSYKVPDILNGYQSSFVTRLSEGSQISKRILLAADWSAKDDHVTVKVEDSVFSSSKSGRWAEELKRLFAELFQKDVTITIEKTKPSKRIHVTEYEFVPFLASETKPKEEPEEESPFMDELKKAPKKDPLTNVAADAPSPKSSGKKTSKQASLRSKTSKQGQVKTRAYDDDPDLIYGRPFKDEARPLDSFLPTEEGTMTVRGRIFSIKEVPLRNGEKTIYSFAITDETDSISVKLFILNEDLPEIREKLKEDTWVKLKGNALMDSFEKELVIQNVVGIRKTDPVDSSERFDTAPVKRVELHCHTKMSRIDAIASAKELISQAKKWGHKALAITDHGSVYAFPEAYKEVKGTDFKVLYGTEGYLVDDTKDSVIRPKGQPFTAPTVVFDLETTGLSPVKNRIIEIGAVKLENGTVTDRFSAFVNPGTPIPLEIELKTHISDDMVKNAPPIEEVLPRFLSFIEGCVLAAHNASFDVGFVSENILRLHLDFPLDFTVVDTLGLSRMMLTKLAHFRLDQVAKELNVPLHNHHRAVDDAECTAMIYLKLMNRCTSMGIMTLDELKEKMVPSAESVRKLFSYHVSILIKNETGRVNLYRILSEASLNYYHEKPLIPKSLLAEHREGLIIGSACVEGELYQALLEGKSDDEIEKIVRFYDYLEIMPVRNNEFLIRESRYGITSEEDIRDINRRIVKLGELFDKPVCATGDVHFLNPEDAFYRQVLQEANGFKDADHQPPLYFRTTDEMLQEFSYLGSDKAFETVVTNTNRIADGIEVIAPVRPDKCPPVIPDADKTLREVCYRKAHEIYGETLPDFVESRLERELGSIISNGYAVMYLIARKLVLKSLGDGYMVGSRGSVGSSLVATMSGITEVNPLKPHYLCGHCHYIETDSKEIRENGLNSGCDLPKKRCPVCGEEMERLGFDIPFETFLGFKGDKEPDIDLNFSGEYQTKAHAYTEVIFGKGQTYRAGTISGIKEKIAYGYFLHHFEEQGIMKRRPELDRLSKKLLNVRKTTGQHPGGIVVLPFGEEIHTFTPVQHPADDPNRNIITTSFEYHAIDQNLLKLDILGHDDPTMMRMLEDLTGIDPVTFPLDSAEVLSLFESPAVLGLQPSDIRNCPLGALGIPEFGTDFAMGMVLTCKPKSFSDLVRIAGMAHGTDVWTNNNQDLFESGQVDLSTAICCRDDIMLYLISVGMEPSLSFEIMEKVRKGKGLTPAQEAEMRAHNVPDWYIGSCKKIKYMFPKAHAVAYVMMAWRIAYAKVHYPAAFYCSHFSIRADEFNYEKMAQGRNTLLYHIDRFEKQKFPSEKEKKEYRIMLLVNEFYARGFEFVRLDLKTASSTLFTIVDEKHLMPSITSIDGMGESAADSIVDAFNDGKGEFSSIQDFKNRTRVSQTLIDKMKELHILTGLPEDDQFSLFDFA